MDASIAGRVIRAGHECVVYDVDADRVAELVADGADGADHLATLAGATPSRRVAHGAGGDYGPGHRRRRGTAVGG